MLPAIEFNDESKLMTGEISEVRTDRRLTAKVMLLERRLAQLLPELLFSCGRVATKGARAWHAGV